MSAFWRGFVYAGRGIKAGSRGRNFRVMLLAAVVVAGAGWWLQVGRVQWAVLVLSMGLVLALELLNTAGEMLVDLLSPEHDPRYGRVKDVLAGAVLVGAMATAVVGLMVLGPPLLTRLGG
jgi:diacylglycerol kinase